MSEEHKNILITGASRGLGSIVAQELSRNGKKIALVSRDIKGLESTRARCQNPDDHISIPFDLMNLTSIPKVIEVAEDFLGTIDVVVHAAGGGLGFKSALIKADELQKLFLLNLASAIEINRLVAEGMCSRGTGNLIHVGSIASAEGVGSVGYNTIKAAIAAYVRSIGKELAPYGVIATGILPGGFISPGNAMFRLKENNINAYEAFIKERLPRGKMGLAEELLPLINFLCTKKAGMMSGCMVPIDGAEGKAYLI